MITSVHDTNVWVAGINWDRGIGSQIRAHWAAGTFQHCISGEILYEVIRVLRDVFGYSDERLYDWYWLLLVGSKYVVPTTIVNIVETDPDDNKFLACAVDGGAGWVVSEDGHLRRLEVYDSIQIVGKHEFLRMLEGERGPGGE